MRPDKVCQFSDGDVIVDFKTCSDPTASAFAWKIHTLAYHRQAALYCEGWQAYNGERPEGFVFVAVRNEPPYDCHCHLLAERALAWGHEANRVALDDLARRLKDNNWHGPGWGRCPEIDLPEKVYKGF
jgi:exodeoxyribonuclease VIII